MMKLINRDGLPIVNAFIRLFGDAISSLVPSCCGDIEFRLLRESENEYHDLMGRVANIIYYSPEEVGRIGLTDSEILAALAHEVGHIAYNTRGWQQFCEERADTFAAELGLGRQMVSAIERILDSRKYPALSSQLIGRIHFLQNVLGEESHGDCRMNLRG